jgi:excisionase family DNA binding protein
MIELVMGQVEQVEHKVDDLMQKVNQLLERETPAGKWLSVAEAAQYAGHSSDDTIRRLIAEGRLGAHRLRPGKLLIDKDELDSCIRTMRDAKPRRKRGPVRA